jgi:hypothetical protein
MVTAMAERTSLVSWNDATRRIVPKSRERSTARPSTERRHLCRVASEKVESNQRAATRCASPLIRMKKRIRTMRPT